MSVADRIRAKLTGALAPIRLEVRDDSERHAGHAGSRSGGESHFRITVVAAAFEGRPRVARHRMVHQALADELAGRVHALELRTLTPAEDVGPNGENSGTPI